jgi:hypothetical protein
MGEVKASSIEIKYTTKNYSPACDVVNPALANLYG